MLATAVAVGSVLMLAAAPAQAAGSDWVRYAGKSINGQKVPATLVTLDAIAGSPTGKVQFIVGGRVLAEDYTVVPEGRGYVASAVVDLTGLRGTTKVRARYFSDRGVIRSVDKSFRAVAPAPGTAVPTRPTPTPAHTPGPVWKAPIPSGATASAGPRTLRGAHNTGVPAGTTLRRSESFTVWQDGAVIDGLDVDGCVKVNAKDVTIKRSRIRCNAQFGQMAVEVGDAGDRVTLEDVEVDGRDRTAVCVGWSRYTLRRVNVHGCADGVRFGHRVVVEDSWVHDISRMGTLHGDALQTTTASDVLIRGNTLSSWNAARRDLNNAAIMMGSETGDRTVRRVLIEHNHLDGGNYTLNVRGDIDAADVLVQHNTFGTNTRYGPVQTPTTVPLGAGNTFAGTRTAVPVNRAR